MNVPLAEGKRFGVIQTNKENRIIGFHEKPSVPIPSPDNPDVTFASMGIYLFNTRTLVKAIIGDAKQNTNHDFGKNIIPEMIHSQRVFAYPFTDENEQGLNYWRDIGTLDAYWEANMDLIQASPEFNIYDKDWPIRTYKAQYPPAKTESIKIQLPVERSAPPVSACPDVQPRARRAAKPMRIPPVSAKAKRPATPIRGPLMTLRFKRPAVYAENAPPRRTPKSSKTK